MRYLKLTLATLVLASSYAANAVPIVVWDQSPDAIGGTLTSGNWTNRSTSQNFADIVRFDFDVEITGMDIYMNTAFGSLGDLGTVRIRTGSEVGALVEFTETVNVIDNDGTLAIASLHRVHVDFTSPLLLLAGVDYWIGMSGTTAVWTQAGITGGTGPLLDNLIARYSGTTFDVFATDVDDQVFRLWGNEAAIPAPGTLALLGLGLVGIAARRRKTA